MTPEIIATALRAELMTGALPPGTSLSQVMLATRFGVSRIPIRDALRILAAEGLVEIEANRGAKAIALTAAEVREIYDLRVLLECDCLRRAAPAMTEGVLADIERVRRKSDLDAGTPRWDSGDWAFHRALYEPAGHPRQLAIIERMRRTCRIYVSVYTSLPSEMPRWLDEHRLIVAHLERGAVDLAVDTLQRHLEVAGQHLLDRMTSEKN